MLSARWILSLLLASSMVLLSSCSLPSPAEYHSVTYEVRVTFHAYPTLNVSDTQLSLTYENLDGGTSQKSGVRQNPWVLAFRAQTGRFLYISAQKDEMAGSDVTVNIYVDGKLLKTSTSAGAYVIATAKAVL